ncbi:TIGR04282 family arsenosugar biosynthesis glycosyltransferase [Calditerrivibrio sp.]|jgi:rSAM/selenodomain-associated transferase 1|uniref:TIGR04282 family arsenosugar biosynthesis glycosyltransferase n=1 Tax=Calditerrivibrio sp. TaxID=2792612 RepID=UPI003D1281C5
MDRQNITVVDKAIAIFCKPPKKGYVKTRLAADTDEEFALRIYEILLRKILIQLDAFNQMDKTVDIYYYISDADRSEFERFLSDNLLLSRDKFLRVQNGSDLGERIKKAFEELFSNNYQKVIIIGSDILGDLVYNITIAFEYLKKSNYVVGPSFDGGFYLIGANRSFDEELFNGITWSSNNVLNKLKDNLHGKLYSYRLLDTLLDVDRYEDLIKGIQMGILDKNLLYRSK